MVHGDDCVTLGSAEEVEWFQTKMQDAYEVKIRGVLGPEAHDCKRIEILNRVVCRGDRGITYEGDPHNL